MIEIPADVARKWYMTAAGADGLGPHESYVNSGRNLWLAIGDALPEPTHTITVELTTKERDAKAAFYYSQSAGAGALAGNKFIKACRKSREAVDG